MVRINAPKVVCSPPAGGSCIEKGNERSVIPSCTHNSGERVGECKVRKRTGDVLFPVVLAISPSSFSGGELVEGVVHKVVKHGVFWVVVQLKTCTSLRWRCRIMTMCLGRTLFSWTARCLNLRRAPWHTNNFGGCSLFWYVNIHWTNFWYLC